MTPSVARVQWPRTHRFIRSIYPPINPFEDITDPADWELIASAVAKTNPRARDAIGAIHLVPHHRRVSGLGASRVMAPFCHLSPERPTRFSDGTYGVYYAGDRPEVALFETIHHLERFMQSTDEESAMVDYRELVGTLDADLHDIRGDSRFVSALERDNYAPAQELGRRLRNHHRCNGLVYPSVRFRRGEAIAAFWPDVVGGPVEARHLCYRWDGSRVDAYLVYGESDWRLVR